MPASRPAADSPARTGEGTRTLTVRLCTTEARKAEFAARTDETSVNEVVRQALVRYFDARREDPDFVARARGNRRPAGVARRQLPGVVAALLRLALTVRSRRT